MRSYRKILGCILLLGLSLLLIASSPLNFSNQHPAPPSKIHWVKRINQSNFECINGWPAQTGEYVPDEYDINFWDGAHNIIPILQVTPDGSWQYLTNDGKTYHIQTTQIWLVPQSPPRRSCSNLGFTPALTNVAPTISPAPTPRTIAPSEVRFQVKREIPAVWAGDPATLPRLTDSAFHPLQDADLVKTDDQGEALLERPSGDRTCRIYVFKDSTLSKSSCGVRSGDCNTSRVEEGGAVFNNCSNHLITTSGGEFRVYGSWVLVIHLPAQQRTLLTVFEGRVEARPVTNFSTGALGPATTVDQGFFWFTNPGLTGDPLAGFDARQPYLIDQLRPIVDTLDLWPWFERVEIRAASDAIPIPNWLISKQCTVTTGQASLWHGPNPSFGSIRPLANGARLRPLERIEDGSWILVDLTATGQIGWVVVRSDWLSCNIDLMTLPPVFIPSQPVVQPTPTPIPPPVIRFTPDAVTINKGQSVTLRWDVQYVQAVYLDGEGVAGQGQRQVSPQQTTVYTLRVVLPDGSDVFRTTTVNVIRSTNPPTVLIKKPANDCGSGNTQCEGGYDGYENGLWYKDVLLRGTAFDQEDGSLSDSSLVWTTNRNDIQNPMLGVGTIVTGRLYSDSCEGGARHEITLTAIDSEGNRSTAVRKIYIWTIC